MSTGTRRYRRFRVEHMNIGVKALFAADTEVLNISLGGACVRAEESFKATAKQLVKIKRDYESLTFPCSVVWERINTRQEAPAQGGIPLYEAGVSFGRLPPDKVVKLKDFIRQSGVPYSQRESDVYGPSLLRFRLFANRQAVMYYAKSLPVRKIGLGGMLIKLDCTVHPGKIFPMELLLPNEGPPLRFRGRVASSIPASGESGSRDTGIEFLDMTTMDRFRLSRFLLFSKVPGEK